MDLITDDELEIEIQKRLDDLGPITEEELLSDFGFNETSLIYDDSFDLDDLRPKSAGSIQVTQDEKKLTVEHEQNYLLAVIESSNARLSSLERFKEELLELKAEIGPIHQHEEPKVEQEQPVQAQTITSVEQQPNANNEQSTVTMQDEKPHLSQTAEEHVQTISVPEQPLILEQQQSSSEMKVQDKEEPVVIVQEEPKAVTTQPISTSNGQSLAQAHPVKDEEHIVVQELDELLEFKDPNLEIQQKILEEQQKHAEDELRRYQELLREQQLAMEQRKLEEEKEREQREYRAKLESERLMKEREEMMRERERRLQEEERKWMEEQERKRKIEEEENIRKANEEERITLELERQRLEEEEKKRKEEEERKRQEEEAKRLQEELERKKREEEETLRREAEERKRKEEEERLLKEEEERIRREEEIKRLELERQRLQEEEKKRKQLEEERRLREEEEAKKEEEARQRMLEEKRRQEEEEEQKRRELESLRREEEQRKAQQEREETERRQLEMQKRRSMELKSASKIQAWWKSVVQQRKRKQAVKAIQAFQKVIRTVVARKELHAMLFRKHNAAAKIQALWKGRKMRKKYLEIMEKCKFEIEDEDDDFDYMGVDDSWFTPPPDLNLETLFPSSFEVHSVMDMDLEDIPVGEETNSVHSSHAVHNNFTGHEPVHTSSVNTSFNSLQHEKQSLDNNNTHAHAIPISRKMSAPILPTESTSPSVPQTLLKKEEEEPEDWNIKDPKTREMYIRKKQRFDSFEHKKSPKRHSSTNVRHAPELPSSAKSEPSPRLEPLKVNFSSYSEPTSPNTSSHYSSVESLPYLDDVALRRNLRNNARFGSSTVKPPVKQTSPAKAVLVNTYVNPNFTEPFGIYNTKPSVTTKYTNSANNSPKSSTHKTIKPSSLPPLFSSNK